MNFRIKNKKLGFILKFGGLINAKVVCRYA